MTAEMGSELDHNPDGSRNGGGMHSFGVHTLYGAVDIKAAGTFNSSMMSSTITGMQLQP